MYWRPSGCPGKRPPENGVRPPMPCSAHNHIIAAAKGIGTIGGMGSTSDAPYDPYAFCADQVGQQLGGFGGGRALHSQESATFPRMFSSSAEEVFKISMLAYLARRPANRLIRWRGERYIPKNVFFLR